MKIQFLIICYIISYSSLISQNYKIGDTLFVVSMNGLNLRKTPMENGIKCSKLETGDKIIVIDNKELLTDSIFGFKGKWVKVKSISQVTNGYVFDAFISRFPVLKELKIINELNVSNWQTGGLYEFMPQLLEEYSLRAFSKIGFDIEYVNGIDDQGGHGMIISKLTSGDLLIKHSYYESYATELELNNVRNSEIYYLVLNILQQLPKSIYIVDEDKLRKPRYSLSNIYQNNCVVKGGDYCIIRIIKKDINKFGIFFHFEY